MKNSIRKVILLLLICNSSLAIIAQGVNISTDYNDVNIAGVYHSNMSGSPYLYDSWVKGSVKLINGTLYEGLMLKFDQMHNELIFLNTDINKMQVFLQPVREFTFIKGLNNKQKFRNGYSIEGENPNTFFEVLVDGKNQFLKKTTKSVVEERGENTLLKIKKIKETATYYLLKNDTAILIRKNDKSIYSAFSGSLTEIKSLIKANKLDMKKEDDIVMLLHLFYKLEY